jgi:3-deoxy-7-phosphoheptulonate synthase
MTAGCRPRFNHGEAGGEQYTMIIVLKAHSSDADIEAVERKVVEFGYEPRTIRGVERTVVAAVGDETTHSSLVALRGLPMVDNVMPVQRRYKMASREFHSGRSVVDIGGEKIGGGHFLTIAGPCSVESREQVRQAARDLSDAGIRVFRGGAFKPRTSPYDFQGLGQEGLDLLAEVKADFGLKIGTEIVGVTHVEQVAAVADVLQVGARNCQNYHLLEVIAGAGRPVLLKRGMATSAEEWLSAAEYLIVHGCSDVLLCERGIRTFENSTRNTLDLNTVALAKRESHLPVVVDPSHAAGIADLVLPLAKAGIAAGADGLIVESHPNPAQACSDAAQQLESAQFRAFLDELQPLIELMTGES